MIRMKIGVTTFWETIDNYGQLIQCWALQQYLRNQGYEPYLIRYSLKRPKKNKVKRINAFVKKCIANFLYATGLIKMLQLQNKLQTWTNIDLHKRHLQDFRERHIVGSRIYHSLDELKAEPPEGDVYITGSDQVWNYFMDKEHLPVYFLQFGNDQTKRISYAASIGHADFPKELQPEVKQYLDKFDAISIRETSAVPVLKQMGYDVVSVLDPTMLLQAEDYSCLIKNEHSKEGVFIYSMNYDSRESIPFDAIKQYAKNKKMPIVVTPGTGWVYASELFEGVEYNYATLPQWISNISKAQLVVTASFHGIVFSILFHRPFIYTPLEGLFSDANNRVLDLLSLLGLEQRVVTDETSFEKAIGFDIDWNIIEERLKTQKKLSARFLQMSIN